VLWVSEDGRTWTDESDPRMGVLTAIVGGPNGFVAIGGDQDETPALWWSVDGTEWEQIGSDAFDSRWTRGSDEDSVDVTVTSGSATSTGYVLVGTDRLCLGGLCRRNGLEYADLAKEVSSDAVVWTSPDGRSWSRLANDGRFGPGEAEVPARASGAEAGPVAAWGSRFVVGGKVDDGPVVWISSPEVAP